MDLKTRSFENKNTISCRQCVDIGDIRNRLWKHISVIMPLYPAIV